MTTDEKLKQIRGTVTEIEAQKIVVETARDRHKTEKDYLDELMTKLLSQIEAKEDGQTSIEFDGKDGEVPQNPPVETVP